MNLSHGHTLLKGGKEGQVTTLLHTTRKTPPGRRFPLDMPEVVRAASLEVLVLVYGATAAAVVTG